MLLFSSIIPLSFNQKGHAPIKMSSAAPFEGVNLSITGLGTQYPPYSLKPSALNELGNKYYPESES